MILNRVAETFAHFLWISILTVQKFNFMPLLIVEIEIQTQNSPYKHVWFASSVSEHQTFNCSAIEEKSIEKRRAEFLCGNPNSPKMQGSVSNSEPFGC